MDNFGLTIDVLHWEPHRERWELVDADRWSGFRTMTGKQSPLPNINSGEHHFVVVVMGDGDEGSREPHPPSV